MRKRPLKLATRKDEISLGDAIQLFGKALFDEWGSNPSMLDIPFNIKRNKKIEAVGCPTLIKRTKYWHTYSAESGRFRKGLLVETIQQEEYNSELRAKDMFNKVQDTLFTALAGGKIQFSVLTKGKFYEKEGVRSGIWHDEEYMKKIFRTGQLPIHGENNHISWGKILLCKRGVVEACRLSKKQAQKMQGALKRVGSEEIEILLGYLERLSNRARESGQFCQVPGGKLRVYIDDEQCWSFLLHITKKKGWKFAKLSCTPLSNQLQG